MLTKTEIDNTIDNYTNVRELVDLIRTMQEEATILKSAVANLVDETVGSTRGWTETREVPMLMDRLTVSADMARVILTACDEIREANTYDVI